MSPKVRSPSLLRKVTFAEGLTSPGGSTLSSPTVRSPLKRTSEAGAFDGALGASPPGGRGFFSLDAPTQVSPPHNELDDRGRSSDAPAQPTTTSVLLRRAGSQEIQPDIALTYTYANDEDNGGLASWPGPDLLPPPLKTPRRITDPADAIERERPLQRATSVSPPQR